VIKGNLDTIHEHLFQWWRQTGRILPWREKISLGKENASSHSQKVPSLTIFQIREKSFVEYFALTLSRDPYRVIVAEMMLQQTQVDRVLPKYKAWMEKWPKIEELAQASLSEVIIFWQGLGYNRRARFLWLLAKKITEEYGGTWPRTEVELIKLPGIGKYTARAVLSFAFGQQVGVVDTNVKRILNRIFADSETGEQRKQSELEYFILADQILPPGQADPWNQALMDFGALICTAKSPKCDDCPLRTVCNANLYALKHGFASYADQLRQIGQTGKEQRSASPKKIRFEETNRYFRGRIMDELRLQSWEVSQLQKLVEEKYGLLDKDRFHKLLDALRTEGMLRILGNRVSLG
jgi:A/G-specific adenine glycosylase